MHLLYQIESNDGILFKAKSGICKKCNDIVMFLKKRKGKPFFLLQFIVTFIIIYGA